MLHAHGHTRAFCRAKGKISPLGRMDVHHVRRILQKKPMQGALVGKIALAAGHEMHLDTKCAKALRASGRGLRVRNDMNFCLKGAVLHGTVDQRLNAAVFKARYDVKNAHGIPPFFIN